MKKSTSDSARPKVRREVKKFWDANAEQDLSEASKKKRAQILKAALETFLELGYEGASMNLVAERAGVIKQTIYSHFQDKQTLFKAVIASLTVDNVEKAFKKQDLDSKPLPVVLRTIAESIIIRHQDPQHGRFVRTMIGEAERFPELADLFADTTIRPVLSLLTDLMRKDKDYEFEDPEAFARIFLGAIVNFCQWHYVLLGREIMPFEPDRILDELVDLVELHRVETSDSHPRKPS